MTTSPSDDADTLILQIQDQLNILITNSEGALTVLSNKEEIKRLFDQCDAALLKVNQTIPLISILEEQKEAKEFTATLRRDLDNLRMACEGNNPDAAEQECEIINTDIQEFNTFLSPW